MIIAVWLAAASVAAAEPAPATEEGLAELRQVYDQSCGVRGYATFNDLCDRMQRQIDGYGRQLARAQRRRPIAPRAPAGEPAGPAVQTGLAPTVPSPG